MKQCPEQMSLFSAEASLDPASPFLWPGSDEARKMTVTSGRKCCALLKSSGPLGSLVRMLLVSSEWRSTRCFLTWKPQVTKQGRLLFRLAASTPRTGVTGSPLWPTPAAQDGKNATLPPSQRERDTLPGAVLRTMWTTPTAADCTGTTGGRNSRSLRTDVGGQLNPEWVEWLMGFPIGWTDLDA